MLGLFLVAVAFFSLDFEEFIGLMIVVGITAIVIS
jgi:hypothetical protein